jgi:hypothetical protein
MVDLGTIRADALTLYVESYGNDPEGRAEEGYREGMDAVLLTMLSADDVQGLREVGRGLAQEYREEGA